MNKKLTLSIDHEVIKVAKVYAKEKGQSLSEMVENYFKAITMKQRELDPALLSPRIQRLRGIIKTNRTLNYRKILEEELLKKYEI